MENTMNFEAITIGACLDNFQKKGKTTVINDGEVVGFQYGGREDGE